MKLLIMAALLFGALNVNADPISVTTLTMQLGYKMGPYNADAKVYDQKEVILTDESKGADIVLNGNNSTCTISISKRQLGSQKFLTVRTRLTANNITAENLGHLIFGEFVAQDLNNVGCSVVSN